MISGMRSVIKPLYNGMLPWWMLTVLRHLHAGRSNILLWHSVAPAETVFTSGLGVTVTSEVFRAQIQHLERHYDIVPLTTLVKENASGRVRSKMVALTFDDGYGDVIQHALPVLEQDHLPATLFLVTSVLGNKRLMWRNKVAYLYNTGREGLVLEELERLGATPPGGRDDRVVCPL